MVTNAAHSSLGRPRPSRSPFYVAPVAAAPVPANISTTVRSVRRKARATDLRARLLFAFLFVLNAVLVGAILGLLAVR
jgi:hypothetical protein